MNAPTQAMFRFRARADHKAASGELKLRPPEVLKESVEGTDMPAERALEAEPVDFVLMLRSPGIKAAGESAVINRQPWPNGLPGKACSGEQGKIHSARQNQSTRIVLTRY